MEDWRLRGQEEYLSNAILYKVQFPEFWKYAYETKNPFYQKIAVYAKEQVERTGKWNELLEDEKVGQFWHEHCEFCWEKPIHIKLANFIAQRTCTTGYARNVLMILQNNLTGRCDLWKNFLDSSTMLETVCLSRRTNNVQEALLWNL